MSMATQLRKVSWLASVSALVAFSGSGHAAPLALQDVPLFISTGAEPNVMLMVDNSGSMTNIVPDTPYNPATSYAPSGTSCPLANRVPTNQRIDLALSSGAPRIRYSSTNYVFGTGSGQRCFLTASNYQAMLNTAGSGFLPSQYTGNYLNWYFNSATDPTTGCNAWSAGRKPCTKSRMMIAQAAGAALVNSMPTAMRTGLSTYNGNDGGQLLDVVGNLTTAKRSSLATAINAMIPTGNTPLGETLSDIGYYFSRGATNLTTYPADAPWRGTGTKPASATISRTDFFNNGYTKHSSWANGSHPIQFSCQKSFVVLLTDGRPTQDTSISASLRDYDQDCNNVTPACLSDDRKTTQTYESSGSDYLNDVAMALYDMDMRPDLSDDQNSKNNVATYLISFADDQAINDPLMASTATNGGGTKYIAGNEAQLNTAFSAALASIVQRTASASSASVNSGSISSDTRIYQAKFNSATWTGQLLSFPVNADGSLTQTGTSVWDARNRIPAAGSRKIITMNSDGRTAVPFRWDAIGSNGFIDDTRKAQVATSLGLPACTSPGCTLPIEPALLNYLRGDIANEGTAANQFRARRDGVGSNVLGDIISSAPLYVGRPPFRYRDSLESAPYSSFASDNAGRRGMVYVGANDGMLHGFDANTGDEVFAYIPGAVFPRLKNLASKTYAHEYFVDGSPSMGDVFFGGAWHTMLVGGLNKGGAGIYALDVTNPGALATAEANPTSIAKWEFTTTNDADLGLTFSQPAIAKLQNGTWAAIFGNGYNSATNKAVLYVVNIADGSLIKKFDTGTLTRPTGVTWDNGMSTPAVVDVDGDRKIEYIYAGDLWGNMWKFDVSATSDSDWNIAFSGSPLFQARDSSGNGQPITVRPEVGRGPQGNGQVVLFGTGKYLELTDKLSTPELPQTFYGIVDRGSTVSSRDSLLEQEITNEFHVDDPDGGGPAIEFNARITTEVREGAESGWLLDLVSPDGYQAEKQVTNPIVRDGKVIFTTLIPNTDACGAGGTSWLMELDMLTGSRLETAPFDINRDGQFDEDDMVRDPETGEMVHLSGIQFLGAGILQSPGVIEARNSGGVCVQYKYMPDSSGNIQRVNESCGPGGLGRQSWRQIR